MTEEESNKLEEQMTGDKDGAGNNPPSGFNKNLIGLLLFILVIILWQVYEYSQAQAIVSISTTESISPQGGKIVLTYRHPVSRPLFSSRQVKVVDDEDKPVAANFISELNKTKTVETIRFEQPTPFNRHLHLIRKNQLEERGLPYLLGLKAIPTSIAFSTDFEHISINDLLPSASRQHAPEALNNQIAILFNGNVGNTYRKRVKLSPREVPFIQLTPQPEGYYQWSDDQTLTFNFSREQPRFNTTYRYTIEPDKLINPEYQKFEGKTSIELTTSSNDVYVNDVSIDNEVEWNTAINFEFSGNMVGVFELNKNKDSSVMPVLMQPQVKGTWRWLNARTVRFIPAQEGWPIRDKVTIEFLPDVNRESDRNWTNNRGLNRIEFFVKPRTQYISNINLRGHKVDPEAVLEVQFSRNLVNQRNLNVRSSMQTAEAPLIITPEIKGEYYWDSHYTLVIEPVSPWSELTEFKVALNPAFNPDDRFEWTGTKEFSFTTAENVITPKFYQIPEVAPSGSEFFSNKKRYVMSDKLQAEQSVWIEFNRPFGKHHDIKTLAKGIKITPSIEGEFVWLSDYLLKFTADTGWKPETDYQIKLTDNLLYFHQQHYAKDSAIASFHIPKDELKFSISDRHSPDQSLVLDFNKLLSPPVKVGRRYQASEVSEKFLPVLWTLDRDYAFEWKSASRLELIPAPYWPASTELALNLNANLLPRPKSQWNPENPDKLKIGENIVELSSIKPQGWSDRNTTIEVVFNKQIKPSSVEIGSKDNSHLATISPALAGDWYWMGKDKLVFKPDGPLAPSTDYSVTIKPERIRNSEFSWYALDENNLPKPYISRFHSPYQSIKQSSATFDFDENNPLKQRFLIDLEFREWTRFDEVEKRFTLWTRNNVDGKVVEVPLIYHLTTEEAKDRARRFRVVSDFIDRPNANRQVYYQVEKGVPALNGNATMIENFKSSFLQERPRFIEINNVQFSRSEGRFSAHLALNAPIEPEKLSDYLDVIETSFSDKLDYQVSVDSSPYRRGQFNYLIEAKFSPQKHYQFIIREGLLAADGALTNEEVSYLRSAPGLKQKLDFALKGNILSKYDTREIPVLSSNVNHFNLSIEKIFPSNVRNFLNKSLSNNQPLGNSGKRVFSKDYNLQEIHDQNINDVELTTGINLSGFFDNNPKGLYRLSLNRKNSGIISSRWFLSSDTALIARRTNEHVSVWAMSLSQSTPLANVKIELVDFWNQTTASGVTDKNGFIRLENKDPLNTHVILSTRGNDISFLDLRTQGENFNGYDVSGVQSSGDATLLQAYLYSERGVYRPGDSLHLMGVVRDQDGALPQAGSVTLVLKDPTGSERLKERYAIDKNGIVSLDYALPADAKTGKWQSELIWRKNTIGSLKFQVEEFIPNKIKVVLSTAAKAAIPGQNFKFDVQSNNLFGPPAAGRKVNAQISLRPAFFKPAGYEEFSFGHDDHRFQQLNEDLIETRLDEKGHHVYEYPVPEGIDSPIGLNLHYSATVIDDSGRGVSQYAQIPVHLYSQYVGVRRMANNTIELGDTVKFETVNVTSAGNKIDSERQSFRYEVFRKRKVTHFRKNERGYYRYVTEKIDVSLQSKISQQNRFDYLSEFSGEHYLQVTDLNGGQVTRYNFNVVGPRDRVSIVEAPESVLMKARLKKAIAGENIQVDIQAPFAGRLLLIAERDNVMWSKSIEMDSNNTTVSLPVTTEQVPNFYLSAIVVQAATKGSRQQPVYATGLLNIPVVDPQQIPSLQITAPKKVSPNGKLTVQVSVDRLDRGDMYFTLAAVDEGILDLTKFKTPNMKSVFNRKQRLDVGHFSVYPWVMPYEPEVLQSISPSGSAPSRALIKKKRENPDAAVRVKSVALWSGLQKFDDKGKATVTFDVPEFDGSLRLMLVSFGDQRFNSAETKVTVRDNLVLKPSLPRFMANGDHFELPFTVFNSTARTGDVSISVKHSDHLELLGNDHVNIQLPAGGESKGSFSFNVKDRLGIANFTLVAEGMNEQTIKHFDVPVRSSGNYISLSDSGIVDAATPKTIQIPKLFKPGTEIQALQIAPAGFLQFTGSLKYLLRYPHGCLEQTTSKLFPLLYFEDFAKSADFHEFSSSTPRYYLREGINKIERMQLENGYFSYWSGSSGVNDYAFLYASHFLAEAHNKGLKINETVWDKLQNRLRNDVLKRFNRNGGYQSAYNLGHQVYALYILALSGNPMLAEMNALVHNQEKQLKAHDRARLASAFKLAGREQEAEKLLQGITRLNEYDDPYRQTSGSFASNTRDLAVLLDALIEVNPQADVVPIVVDKLSNLRRHGRWGSTQDNAVAMMALGKSVARKAKTQSGDLIVTLAGGKELVNQTVNLSTIDLLSGEVSIRTTEKAEANYFWQADGVSNATTVVDEDHGIQVRRQYLNTKKELVNLNQVQQGDLIVVQLTLSSKDGRLDNVAVTDLLPMGLEIENARLSTSAEIPWLKSTASPDHTDIRDDRMNLYMTLTEQEVVYYYTTRAVTVGHFVIPSVRAEAMYDESKYSLSGAGTMKVLPMQ